MDDVFTYSSKNKIQLESDYPTSGVSGSSCAVTDPTKGKVESVY